MTVNGSAPNRGELARLLREARSAYDPQGVEALIAGVLGAPQEVGASWHMLVADPVTPALAEALEALRSEMAAGYRDGLAREDFAALPSTERLARLRRELSARRPRRVHRAALGRASGRIRAAARPAPGLAHRLYRLGRAGDRAAPSVRRCSSTADTPCRRRSRSMANLFEIHHLIDEPPAALDRQRPDRRRRARLRPVAAHAARGRAVPRRGRKGRGELARGRRQPARRGLAGPAGRAPGPGGAARPTNLPARPRSRNAPGSPASWPQKASRR